MKSPGNSFSDRFVNNTITVDHYIDAGEEGEIDLRDPALSATIGLVASASEMLLGSASPTLEPSGALRAAASLIRDRVQNLSELMTREQGNPLAESRDEWLLTAGGFDWATEEGLCAHSRDSIRGPFDNSSHA